jgi:hypothetical protein
MRARLTAALVLAAAALPDAAYGLRERSHPASPPVLAEAAAPAGASRDRVLLRPADVEAAAAAGLLPGDARSLLRVDRALRYGEFVWRERGVPAGPVTVIVDLRAQTMSVFRAGHEIASTVVLYGADGHDTPLGEHPVRGKVRDHHSQTYDAPMPFTLWLTDDGVAIHGSDVRRGRATHGCIGVPPAFAERLFEAVEVGDPVRIVESGDPRERAATT